MTGDAIYERCIECPFCVVSFGQFYCQDEAMMEESTRGRLIGWVPPVHFPFWCPRCYAKLSFCQAKAVK